MPRLVLLFCIVFAYDTTKVVALEAIHDGSGFPFESLFSAGALHTCFINASRLVCWGDSELGNCNPPNGSFRAVSSGSWHTCAIELAGNVKCFGSGYALQQAPPSVPVWSVSAGFASTCAVSQADASLLCWGTGIDASQIPQGRFTSVSVGTRSACAIRQADASLACWGADEFGQISKRPTGGSFATISCGGGHCCALTSSSTVVCWGGSDEFAVTGRPQPQQVASDVRQVTSGEDHACALTAAGGVHCWGKCSHGACDPPPDGGPYALLSAGGAHTCGIRRDAASVDCWGRVPGTGAAAAPSGPLVISVGPPAGAAGGSGGVPWEEVQVSGVGPGSDEAQVAPAASATSPKSGSSAAGRLRQTEL